MGHRLSPARRAGRRRSGLSRSHSLRLRLLGAMVAVFALGLGASLLSYRTEVHEITGDLRERTLENQARELLEALRVGAGRLARSAAARRLATGLPRAHRGSSSTRYSMPRITLSPGRAIWHSRCPTSRSTRTAASARSNSSGRAARRAIVAAHGPRGSTVLVGRSDMTATSSSTASSRRAPSSSRSSRRSRCSGSRSSG